MVKYPSFTKIDEEILVDPHSKMAYAVFYKEPDPCGDPLDVLTRCEEGDEVALSITCFEFHDAS